MSAKVVNGNGGPTASSAEDDTTDDISKKRKKLVASASKSSKKKKLKENAPELVPVIDYDLLDASDDGDEDLPSSLEAGDQAFEWMISPTVPSKFYSDYWEKKPLYIKRTDQTYFKSLFSTKALEKIIREQRLLYGKNIDITSFDKDKRETHNPSGRVYPAVLWDFFNNGCSIRMLNPQTFHSAVWRLCATLQDHFHSMVGANVYLTPPGTQGFAPHWDDVEAFMLQLEGKKHWKIYGPRDPSEVLPRYSSENLSQSEMTSEPVIEVDLEPGDMIYMPRGTIHQGNCLEGEHSLHITISAYQLNSWTDLLEKLLPAALAEASAEDVEFRQGIPRDCLLTMGVAREEEKDTQARKAIKEKVNRLVSKLVDHLPLDGAVDQLGKRLMGDILPPALEVEEKARTVYGDGEKWHGIKKTVVNRVEIDPDTHLRLVRASAVRLVQEEDTVKMYYSTENTREFREVPIEDQQLEVGEELAPAVEHLITSYPSWVKVEDLPIPELEDRMKVAGDMWEKGVLITREPLEAHYDDP